MANIKLKELNYIVTGSRQKILNVDLEDESGVSQNNKSFFTDNEAGTYAPAPLCVSFGFSGNQEDGKNRNEYGFVFTNDPSKLIRTLYDVKDVALKSAVAEQIGLKRSDSNDDGGNEYDGQVEIYFPHLREDPIGFVQLDQYAYGMTQKTVVGPVIKRTNLYEKRNSVSANNPDSEVTLDNSEWNFFLNPYDKYGSTEADPGVIPNLIPTYLYTPLSSLQTILFNTLTGEYEAMLNIPELSADTLSTINTMTSAYTSSYYSFLTFYKERGADLLSNLFKPVYNFENIDHNYIIELPLVYTSRLVNIDNQYNMALVNADTILGKNTLDDLYDTNTTAPGVYPRIREYQNINAVGNKLFLTYFDDESYRPASDISSDLNYEHYDSEGTYDVALTKQRNQAQKRDYQKVECINAINRFVSTTVHKANLFGVRVYGLEKVLGDKRKYSAETQDRIKRDIRNGIRRIVSNFVPAHAQYFDVYDSEGRVGIKNLDEFSKQHC